MSNVMYKSPFFYSSALDLLSIYIGIPSPSIFFTLLGLIITSMGTSKVLPSRVGTLIGSLLIAYCNVIEQV